MHIKAINLWLTLACSAFFMPRSCRTDAAATNNSVNERDVTFNECGGVLRNQRGIISTPGFPDSYPIPIHCRWVIEATSDKVVALYFTQFYMREGLSVAEYAFFSDTLYLGKKDFGIISSDREPTYLVSNKPVLVLEFDVKEGGNVHMRVREHLLDVYGFNVTYEVLGRNETVRKDPCLYNHCSFTGSCLASTFYDGYYCKCFADFFGSECQYNPGCEPSDSGGLCFNGGTCRYYIGSTLRSCECPPGFQGLRCEKRKNEQLPAPCISLGCSQSCSLSPTDEYRCSCFPGYIITDDRKSCVEKGRTRYLVSFKLYDQNVDLAHLDSSRYSLLKKGIENALLQLFQPRLYKTENLTVLNFQPGAVVQFHFFGEKEDSHQAKAVFEESLKRGRVGRYAVDKNYIRFEWEPALSIQGVEPSEKMPVVEGAELSLACIAQGSSAMEVRWFKDGAVVDVATKYRNLWTTTLPRNSKDQYTSLLGFKKASVQDTGEFVCQITDWGTVQNKSIHVLVVAVPKPTVIPLTATVIQGSSFVVTCLSEEDHFGSFGYNWLKNGRILNPSTEPELVEDLFPAGSRLLVGNARASATYTCIITSTAGASRRDSLITVLTAAANVPVCLSQRFMEIKWGDTAANTEDIKPCPKGYVGEVRRHCTLKKGYGGVWGEPDFSRCLSKELIFIQEKFESLRMGYVITDVSTLMEKLRIYLQNVRNRFHIAEGEPVVDLLEGLHEYERTQNKLEVESVKNTSQVFMDIVSNLLDSPWMIQKQSHVIKLHQQILSYGLLHGRSVTGENFYLFERPTVVLEVGQVQNEGQHVYTFPTQRLVRDTGLRSDSKAVWLTDSVELDFDTWMIENIHDSANESISIAVVFYKNFSALLPDKFLARQNGLDLEYQLHSNLVAVAMQANHRRSNNPLPSNKNGAQRLKVKARLAHLNKTVNHHIAWNISCGMADFSHGNFQFVMQGCQPVQTGNYSLCQCNQAGTYAVLLTTYAQSEHYHFNDSFEIIAGIGCATCAFFVCLTFFILLVLWRKISGAITALKMQVCLALIGAYVTFLVGLQDTLERESYTYVISLIQYFLLAAFCMQLCLGLTVYIEFVDLKDIRYPEAKLATLGWAVPMIVVGATLAAQVPEGFNLKSWWLELHTNHFYAYSASILIMAVLHFLLVMTVKTELKCRKKLDSPDNAHTGNRAQLLHRSLAIATSLILVSVSSILYVNYDEDIFKYAFAGSSGVLGIVIFLCYTVCSENVQTMCSSSQSIDEDILKQEPRLKNRQGMQGFSKPEIVSDSYCVSNIPDVRDTEVRLEEYRQMGYRIPAEETKDWEQLEQLIQQKGKTTPPSCIVRDFTVHSEQQYLRHKTAQQQHHSHQTSRQEEIPRSESEDGFRTDMSSMDPNSPHSFRKQWRKLREGVRNDPVEPISPPFELQELEGSPKSCHVNFEEDEVVKTVVCYETSYHGSAPDILEPTNNKSGDQKSNTADRSLPYGAEQYPSQPSKSALSSNHNRPVICSTFRPPPESFQTLPCRSSRSRDSGTVESIEQKRSVSPCPAIQSMIGDDKLSVPGPMLKREVAEGSSRSSDESLVKKEANRKGLATPPVGLNVPTPKVPQIEIDKSSSTADSDLASHTKKGWSMTTV